MSRGRSIRSAVVVTSPSHAYLVITDPMAGHAGRYTVHEVSLVGNKETKVVGRELPKRAAESLVRRLASARVAE